MNISNQTAIGPAVTLSSVQIVSIVVDGLCILTVLFNVAVFAKLYHKDSVYQYLFVSSIVDVVYLVAGLYLLLIGPMCDASPLLCGSMTQYVSKISTVWIQSTFNASFAFYSILNEMFLSLQRLLILRKNTVMKNWRVWQVGPVMALIALSVYLPTLAFQSVQLTGQVTFNGVKYAVYSIVPVPNSASTLSIFQAFLRASLVTVGMTVLNAITLYNFRLFVKQKLKITSSAAFKPNATTTAESGASGRVNRSTSVSLAGPRSERESLSTSSSEYRANRNITIMLVSTSTLYIVGTMPYMIFIMMRYLSTIRIPADYISSVYIFIVLLVGLKPFVYYFCNKVYRQALNDYFGCNQ